MIGAPPPSIICRPAATATIGVFNCFVAFFILCRILLYMYVVAQFEIQVDSLFSPTIHANVRIEEFDF